MPTYAAQTPARVQALVWNRVFAAQARQQPSAVYYLTAQAHRANGKVTAQFRQYLAAAVTGTKARASTGLLYPVRPRR